MAKQQNNYNLMLKFNHYFATILLLLTSYVSMAQETEVTAKGNTEFVKGKEYILGEIVITGLDRFSEQTVKVHSGLIKDTPVKLPGDKLTAAIKRLYDTKQFSKVDVYVTKIENNVADIEINVTEIAQLNDIIFTNFSKSKSKTLQEDAKIKTGEMVTDNLLVTTKNFFEKKYRDEGFLNTKVTVNTKKSEKPNAVDMIVHIDKGPRVKINQINFHGNDDISSTRLKKQMKKTKERSLVRFWKKSKFIDEQYREDLKNVINVYSEKGYRDAVYKDKKITKINDKLIDIDLYLDEGKQYYLGNIDFVGNTKFTDEQLNSFLKIDKGDIYNSKILKDRVTGDGTAESDDIQTLYLNNGYLFANVTPVETRVYNDSIDVEIRIYEDEPATIRKISVSGNDKTYDHVIYRELRTKPGNLFSKDDIIRSIREIGQLGFFDAQNISPDVKPNRIDKTVDINYSVAEKGSSQIQLQGGYGGNSFIGTLGLSFNNFSVRNLLNKKAYTPLPMGDGQALSLNLQKSKYYSTYSFSFTEPWLGGKKPKSLSMSVYYSAQYGYDYTTYDVDKNQGLNIWGASLGLGQRLKWPDDWFQLSQTIGYQRYDLKNYQIFRNLNFSTGVANNLSYNVVLARNSSGPDPIFPQNGSEISFGVKLTPPYSLLSKRDYNTLTDQEKYQWLEYYKTTFKSRWYTPIYKKMVLMTNTEFGFLGYYNKDIGYSPFEKYNVGGSGMAQYRYDGSETIGLRGYIDGGLTNNYASGTVYNKFTFEARYPITLKPSASIYVTGFAEAGNAYETFREYNPFKLKRSAGVGLRVFMPMFGLLGIDFANGFDPLPGRTEKSGWQTHFILGQQF